MNNKTAIIFTGTCRSLLYTHDNIKTMLIDPIENCDVFIILSRDKDTKQIMNFLDLPQVKFITIEQELDCDLTPYIFRPGFPSSPLTSKQIYAKMITQRKKANEMLSWYEIKNSISYDRVIFSRLDVKYFDNVTAYIDNLDLTNLYVPDFHNTFGGVINGYNDRFAISNRKNMETYFNLPDSLEPFCNAGNKITPESFLKWHLLKNNIIVKHIPIRFGRVRSNGEEIDIRLKTKILTLGDRDV